MGSKEKQKWNKISDKTETNQAARFVAERESECLMWVSWMSRFSLIKFVTALGKETHQNFKHLCFKDGQLLFPSNHKEKKDIFTSVITL